MSQQQYDALNIIIVSGVVAHETLIKMPTWPSPQMENLSLRGHSLG